MRLRASSGLCARKPQPLGRNRRRGRPRTSGGGWRGILVGRCAHPHAAHARPFCNPRRTQDHGPAGFGCAGHRGGRCAAQGAKPRVCCAGVKGDGGAPQYWPVGAHSGEPPDPRTYLLRPRLCLGPTHQCRRPCGQVGPWRASAHNRGRGGGARDCA